LIPWATRAKLTIGMINCEKCQVPLDGTLCLVCGANYESAPAARPAQPGRLSDNEASAICYVLWTFTGLIMLILRPYNKNKVVRFHAVQAIVLTPFWLALIFTVGLFCPPEYSDTVFMAIQFGTLALWAFLIGMAYSGKRVVIPMIGSWAEKEL